MLVVVASLGFVEGEVKRFWRVGSVVSVAVVASLVISGDAKVYNRVSCWARLLVCNVWLRGTRNNRIAR